MRIRHRYNNHTNVCRQILQRERHIQLENVARDQVREVDISATTSRKESGEVGVFRQFGIAPWVKLGIRDEDIMFEQLFLYYNDGVTNPYASYTN